jgi:hypothetical protein
LCILHVYCLESKLLKPGKRYILGRKDTDLLIQSKKISREHVAFNISEFPTSRVVSYTLHLSTLGQLFNLVQDDPAFKPKARLQNLRNKPLTIRRGENLITANSSSGSDLCDGDTIHLVGGVIVMSVVKGYRYPLLADCLSVLQDLLVSNLLQKSRNFRGRQGILCEYR